MIIRETDTPPTVVLGKSLIADYLPDRPATASDGEESARESRIAVWSAARKSLSHLVTIAANHQEAST
jgi:hypothetical protein